MARLITGFKFAFLMSFFKAMISITFRVLCYLQPNRMLRLLDFIGRRPLAMDGSKFINSLFFDVHPTTPVQFSFRFGMQVGDMTQNKTKAASILSSVTYKSIWVKYKDYIFVNSWVACDVIFF